MFTVYVFGTTSFYQQQQQEEELEEATEVLKLVYPSYLKGRRTILQVLFHCSNRFDIHSEWRERAQQTIDECKERNREKHEKTIEQAHADIDRFYEDYNAKKINILKQNE